MAPFVLQMRQTISHYRLIEPLGSGGEGQVWKAEDLRLKRTVAIKFLNNGQVPGEQANERFRSEAQMAAALSHSNIAAIYELGEAGDRLYIVMECVDGEDLKSIIERGPLELTAVIDIAMQIIEALAAAHTRGLIHSDLKSSNVMVTSSGLVKILDFGLARLRSAPAVSATHEAFPAHNPTGGQETQNESARPALVRDVSGTPGYMSPEQLRGEALDQRTDIFSLGVVLYEMLTARQPFEGERRASVLHAVLNEEPSPLSSFRDDVPLELEGILRKSLAKDRNERYATAEDLSLELSTLKGRLEKMANIDLRLGDDTRPESATAASRPDFSAGGSKRIAASPPVAVSKMALSHQRFSGFDRALGNSSTAWRRMDESIWAASDRGFVCCGLRRRKRKSIKVCPSLARRSSISRLVAFSRSRSKPVLRAGDRNGSVVRVDSTR